MQVTHESKMRVAVEGCGHGTLNAIYSAVEHSCAEKGWDSVDVLIIGGDFQAVRNKHDLNVTAMPAKYREMADFHEYYSGTRVAPVLTIFIGGNHEASNHLFELYYGGWVAPNIYYMGAANVLKIGNLRVAGMSGIWKGYDFRRPHYERLPYNNEETYGIYHVRELDVRKLLAIRSQVDIGLSHDWPQTIEWSGNWQWLFKKKDRFQDDAEKSKLGNTAAKMVLDRLRPKHWFSAHLHIRYEATYDHNDPEGIRTKDGKLIPQTRHTQQLSAWHGFQGTSQVADAEEHKKYLAEQQERRKEQEKDGGKIAPSYVINETFNQVSVNDDLSRKVNVVDASAPANEGIPQLDGGCASRPLKRPREPSGSPEQPSQPGSARSPRFQALSTPWPRDIALDNPTMEQLPREHGPAPVARNPDELDLDLSDDDENSKSARTEPIPIAKNPDEIDLDMSDEDDNIANPPPRSGSPFPTLGMQMQSRKSDLSEDGGVPIGALTVVNKSGSRKSSADSTRSSLNASAKEFVPLQQNGHVSPRNSTESDLRAEAAEWNPTETTNTEITNPDPVADTAVPDDIQAELQSTSKIFQKPVHVEVSPALPYPEEIANTTTHFLALDKCLPGRHFLELLEIEPVGANEDGDEPHAFERPVKLQYDPEWLAILRVFASELQLGGNREDKVPVHRGDTYYDERIFEERKWISEHIVSEGKLEVPENFEITAPVYDPNLELESEEMPREVTNPQTSAFCKLIGIENPFDISEQERDARMLAGPKPTEDRGGWGGRGRVRGRGRGGGYGRGRGGGRGGGFNRGRGRGGGGRGHYLNH